MSLRSKLQSKKISAGLLSLALALGFFAGAGIDTRMRTASAAEKAPAPLAIPDPVQLSTTFTQLAKKLEPSVVQVNSTTVRQNVSDRRGGGPGIEGEDPMDLFRRFFGGDPFRDMPREPFRRQSTGSGFIVDPNGYVLTNSHVVDRATRVQVQLNGDSKQYTAKVVGSDPELDLAVLKIDAGKPLRAVELGNSDAVQVGDWAVAIGSPFGLDQTVTAGIISAKGREIGGRQHQLQRFLQTDAAINPGNSGGPLLNIRGEVIGINTAIATETGGYQGIGFALPINVAVGVYDQLVKTGKVSRGAIGISFNAEEKPELLKAYGASEGVFVREVTPGGPADKAGIRSEDIIVAYDGKPVKNGNDLVTRVSQTPVGSEVPVTVLRDGKQQNLKLQVGDRSVIVAGGARPNSGRVDRSGEVNARFGMSVRDVTPRDRQELGFSEKSGVLIADVQDGSFAEDIGLRPGDILTAINRQPVNSVSDVQRIQASLKAGDAVAFRVLRSAPQPGGAPEWQPFFAAGTLPSAS
jgi:serine protease Do